VLAASPLRPAAIGGGMTTLIEAARSLDARGYLPGKSGNLSFRTARGLPSPHPGSPMTG
jgi:hypothetical protein